MSRISRKLHILIPVLLTVLMACVPAVPLPTPTPVTPTVTPTFTPTPSPTPTPTATPIPPQVLTVQWPDEVSGLQPVHPALELLPPPGVAVTSTVWLAIYDPAGKSYWERRLKPLEEHLYVSDDELRFPLEPLAGDWMLFVFVNSSLAVEGNRSLFFQPTPIQFRDFAEDAAFRASAGVDIRVPEDFDEIVAEGDAWAGRRVWRYEDGEVELWWAPGPTEPLAFSTAFVVLEATYAPEAPVRTLDVEEVEWQGRLGYLFRESWLESEDGPAETLVVQGPDYWLYVLRVRALGAQVIPPLARLVWESFSIVEEVEE